MIKLFLRGLVFGLGFCTAVGIALFVASHLQFSERQSQAAVKTSFSALDEKMQREANWRELSLSEKLNRATAIVVLRFNKEEQGLNRAYVEKVVKKHPNVQLNLEVGSEVEKANFFSEGGNTRDRNGVVKFYTQNPALEVEGLYLYDDRLIGEGSIPLHVLLNNYTNATEAQ